MSHFIHRLAETLPPGAEPLTLEETKTFLRIDHDNDDDLVQGLIAAARQMCENATGRSLITRSYSLYLDRWPEDVSSGGWWDGVREGAFVSSSCRSLPLPMPPLLSVTRSNVYAADNTAAEVFATDYFVDTAGIPGRVVLTEGASPPVAGRGANGIEIQFKAGYGATAQRVPVLLRQGMKQIVAHLYEHRGDDAAEALTASGAVALFQSYRVMVLS